MSFNRHRKDSNRDLEKGRKAAAMIEKTQVSLWIDAKLYKKAKQRALDNGQSITSVIESCLKESL